MCGIFGSFSSGVYLQKTLDGLRMIQHRGQEFAGIAYIRQSNSEIKLIKTKGKVNDLPVSPSECAKRTRLTIGHVRYTTSGNKEKFLAHPLKGHLVNGGEFAIAFNGNIPRCHASFAGIDVEFIRDFIQQSTDDIETTLIKLMKTVKGVYCISVLVADAIYLIRDRYGYKPLAIYVDNHTFSSEYLGDYNTREVKPGELIKCGDKKFETVFQYPSDTLKLCLFEYIYFMNPASSFGSIQIEKVRVDYGKTLAKKSAHKDPENAIVIGVPYSGIVTGQSYAKQNGLEYFQGISKKRNIRTFIMPSNEERIDMCKLKYGFDDSIKNRKVILVDDSIVRGNTLKTLIHNLREFGCAEIHIRIASPMITHPCFYGVDMPTVEELIASEKNANRQIEYIREYINADSLVYLDVDECVDPVTFRTSNGSPSGTPKRVCDTCFTGKYNSELNKEIDW
uniref:amidophosphoribosyltransferase n=1 Tax=viral metagenome TaxID=1070528 RepID=A0A6C0CKL8_9ZZZZ